jgi:hypothetical protein
MKEEDKKKVDEFFDNISYEDLREKFIEAGGEFTNTFERDFEISELMFALRVLWERHPNLRFFQLINLICTSVHGDPFYLEDEKVLKIMRKLDDNND